MDFLELLDFVRDMRFDRLGCFAYSREDGTPAAEFDDQIPREVALDRADRIMEAQQQIAFLLTEKFVGKTLPCFIEGRIEDGVYVGRSYRDAPSVDSSVFIETDRELISGEFYNVLITKADGYDMVGSLL